MDTSLLDSLWNDPEVPKPEFPWLVPEAQVEISQNSVRIVTPLRDESSRKAWVVRSLKALVPLIDGTHRLADILDIADNERQTELRRCMAWLISCRVLEDVEIGAVQTEKLDNRWHTLHEKTLFLQPYVAETLRYRNRYELVSYLHSLRIVVDGAHHWCERLDAVLTSNGMDAQVGYELTSDDIQVQQPDLVLFVGDHATTARCLELNQICLSAGVRFLPASFGSNGFVIGPCVLPGGHACYACYQETLRADVSELDPAADGSEPDSQSLVAGIGLNLLTIMALDVLAEAKPSRLVSSVALFSGARCDLEYHPVLRSPDCTVCRRARERLYLRTLFPANP